MIWFNVMLLSSRLLSKTTMALLTSFLAEVVGGLISHRLQLPRRWKGPYEIIVPQVRMMIHYAPQYFYFHAISFHFTASFRVVKGVQSFRPHPLNHRVASPSVIVFNQTAQRICYRISLWNTSPPTLDYYAVKHRK